MSTKPSSNTRSHIDGVGATNSKKSTNREPVATPSVVVLRQRPSITAPASAQRGTSIDNPVKDTANSTPTTNDNQKRHNCHDDIAYIVEEELVDVGSIPIIATTGSLRITSDDDDDDEHDNECRQNTTTSTTTSVLTSSACAKGQSVLVVASQPVLQADQAPKTEPQQVVAVDRDANDHDLLVDADDADADRDDDAMAADDISGSSSSNGERQQRSAQRRRQPTTTTTTTTVHSRTPDNCPNGMCLKQCSYPLIAYPTHK